MDYKEKYEQALERAKVINPGTADYEVAVKIFPELQESESEKIRKELIHFVRRQIECHDKPNAERDEIFDSWITWLEKQKDHEDELEKAYKTADEVQYRRGYEAAKREFEKQGEQKPADKVEPKFKVGDWLVCCNYEPEQIIGIKNNMYEMSNGDIRPIDMINNNQNIRLWSIQDAKNGDVLVHNNCTFIFMGIKDGLVQALEENFLDGIDPVNFGNPNKDEDYHPATKEQRDLLFQKMKEAGYELDAEKKELKKIEKPAEWSEEDEKTLNTIIEKGDLKPSEIGWLKSLKERIKINV